MTEDYRNVTDEQVHFPDRAQWVSLALLVLGVAALVLTVQLLRTSPQQVVTSPTESTIAGASDDAVEVSRYYCAPVTAGSGFDDRGFDIGGQYGAANAETAATYNESPVRTVIDGDDESTLRAYNLNDTVVAAACSRARAARTGHAVEAGLLGVVLLGGAATVSTRRRVAAACRPD